MTIQQINSASIAVYLSPKDLADHGYLADGLTIQQAFHITRLACEKLGFSPAGILEIEAFPNSCGVLVFATLHENCHMLFHFSDLETLLSAVAALPSPFPNASLTYWEDGYYLSFMVPNPSYTSIISEFGQSVAEPRASYLIEHGTCIIPQHAFERLTTAFALSTEN
ncbi:MAG: adaptor protein MecA [Oscillospiraceae bacterium]|nr:adaptor protein MecA [Oscillospiraceae bacterium]